MSPQYRIKFIPKSNGEKRHLYIPHGVYKEELLERLAEVELIHSELNTARASYAFLKGRNCALMATQHVGFAYTLTVDIKDFFDSVHRRHLTGLVPDDLLDLCLIDDAPRQGLPTSPLLASIAMLSVDSQIMQLIGKLNGDVRYTRYADDLAFSFDDKNLAAVLSDITAAYLKLNGFELNPRKTKLQSRKNGRRIITGIGVDDHGIHPTRATLRRLRAAEHQSEFRHANGLAEWAKCRLPKQK